MVTDCLLTVQADLYVWAPLSDLAYSGNTAVAAYMAGLDPLDGVHRHVGLLANRPTILQEGEHDNHRQPVVVPMVRVVNYGLAGEV